MASQQPPTQTASSVQPQKQGCGAVVVAMIAVLALIIGVVTGGVAVYFVAANQPDALGLDAAKPAAEAPAEEAAKKPAETPAAAVSADYALLYPIEESLRIEGPLPKEVVTNQVKDRRYELRGCYQKGLESDPGLKGEMSLQFTVSGENGKVIAAVERHTSFPSEKVKDCLLNEIKSWKFSGKKLDTLSVVKFDVLMIPITSSGIDKK